MIRAFLALLLLAAVAACGGGRDSPLSPTTRPALWAIEGTDGRPAGWLFGTIHALPEETRWETPAITRAMEDADILVVEVRDLDPERTAAALNRLAHDNPGPPLAERLPPTARAKLNALLERSGVPAGRFDGLETWAAALAVSRLAITDPNPMSVDTAMIERFAGRPIAELEGATDQLAVFDALSERDQRSLLTAIVAEQNDPAANPRAVAQAWLAGDLSQLEAVSRRGLLADPALYEALASRRNAGWIAKILPLLESGRQPLVAVGAAHMLGRDSLPALLAAKGYVIRRIQ